VSTLRAVVAVLVMAVVTATAAVPAAAAPGRSEKPGTAAGSASRRVDRDTAGPALGAARLRDGARKFARGHFADAERIFARIAASSPRDRHAWLWLGVARFYRENYSGAAEALGYAARLSPRDAVVLLWWGHALVRTRDHDRAIVAFRLAARGSGSDRARRLAVQAIRALEPGPAPASAEVLEAPVPSGAPYAAEWVFNVDSYRMIAQYYNRRLSDAEATIIAQAVVGYSRRFNIDPRFVVALIVIESGFQPRVVSRAGAVGLGQLMPGTADALGVNPWDPTQNLYGAIRYLRGNLDRFGWENPHLALAAYNAGRGAVERYDGIPPYAETQWYVYNVTTLYRRFLTMTGKMPELSRRV
jgi:soluble lytic murein transglycosylase-like protein